MDINSRFYYMFLTLYNKKKMIVNRSLLLIQ